MSIDNPHYAVRVHDRLTEDDPSLATIMQSFDGIEGPWHDMVTGDADHVYDILEALLDRRERHSSGATMRNAVLTPGGYAQILVEVWDSGQVHVAHRDASWETWSAGAWGVLGPEVRCAEA